MNRQDVLEHALATLDAYGFADLSMRRLATSLGVQPGAIYWHFANKQSLLSAIAGVILDDVSRMPTGHDWAQDVRRWAQALRSAMLAHRDGAELVASVLALRPPELTPYAPCLTTLTAAGLGEEEARAASAALLHYVVGHTVDTQNHAQARALGVRGVTEEPGADEAAIGRFRYGLELFLVGLHARVP
ncbi:transcriptional regulator, TetR family [Austwickia chelonae]|uniref:Putative TetR family transcriptional regulator n=1 Tax=Austwickia chelonae NBRC 105200 TaxID=1184607 RepID=K6UNY1_9MICO|nr:TetR/AcrR family transcriptional regulator C-terminal domain-containing protein [Austwickia chelonae]GAB79346.1 putative TetR family transcriptional regulator [Austwickia chelonae NBRC 105200]SEW44023.1 transcriptional regulator, TetR family [Austwickia chelonae]